MTNVGVVRLRRAADAEILRRMSRLHGIVGLCSVAALLAACASAPEVRRTSVAAPTGVDGDAPRFLAAAPIQCAPYARQASGLQIFGDANTWWTQAEGRYPRSALPSVGAILALRTYDNGARGHVAVVRRIVSDRLILVDHANWHGRGEVVVGAPVRDVSAAGDWSQVNVWWLDANSWGAKTYAVDGFIHPR